MISVESVLTGDEAADEIASENFRIKSRVRMLLKVWTFTMSNLNSSSKTFNVTPQVREIDADPSMFLGSRRQVSWTHFR